MKKYIITMLLFVAGFSIANEDIEQGYGTYQPLNQEKRSYQYGNNENELPTRRHGVYGQSQVRDCCCDLLCGSCRCLTRTASSCVCSVARAGLVGGVSLLPCIFIVAMVILTRYL